MAFKPRDVAGQNPYQLNTVFAVAASNLALPSATAGFRFPPNLFFTNTSRTVAPAGGRAFSVHLFPLRA